MINCAIVEDEPSSAERLTRLLEKNHSAEIQIQKWLKTAGEAIDFLKTQPVDLVFFDVEIGQVSAFEILENLASVGFKIIFTTAHREYALEAIKHTALDYLLKPIDADELRESVDKVLKIDGKETSHAQIQTLVDFLKTQKSPSRIALPTLLGTEYVPVDEIIRCKADVNYTHIFLKDSRKITLAKTLKDIEGSLVQHGFFRTHNSHLVNLGEVRFYNKGKGGFLILTDGSEVEVASRRKEELLRALAGY